MELSHSLENIVIVHNIVAADCLHKPVILSVPMLLLGQVSKASGSACFKRSSAVRTGYYSN